MRTHLIILAGLAALTALTGCGLMPVPMVSRLDAQQQREVDSEVENVLAPANRLDHQALLDALMFYQFHERGVDRVTFRAEKTYSAGTIVMEVFYDRAQPETDRFVVEIYDKSWKLVRRESYNRQDVEQTGRDFANRPPEPKCDDQGNPLPKKPEDAARWEAYQKRLHAIIAATQPAEPFD